MRLTNYSAVRLIPGIYYFGLVTLFLIVFLNYQFQDTLFPDAIYYRISISGIFFIMVYVYFGGKYFEYDSDGSLVSISNRGIILSNFLNYRTREIEKIKENICDYYIYNFFIYKRLVICTKSKKGLKKYRSNITFLSPQKIRYIKQSLSRIIEENKQL